MLLLEQYPPGLSAAILYGEMERGCIALDSIEDFLTRAILHLCELPLESVAEFEILLDTAYTLRDARAGVLRSRSSKFPRSQ